MCKTSNLYFVLFLALIIAIVFTSNAIKPPVVQLYKKEHFNNYSGTSYHE